MKQIPFLLAFTCILLIFFACDQNRVNEAPLANTDNDSKFTFKRGGSPVEVRVYLSSAEIELIDFLTITVETRYPEDTHITPPFLSETNYSPLLLIENPKNETVWSEKDQLMINRWTYTFEPSLSGEFELRPFTVSFRLNKEKQSDLKQWPVYQIHTEPIAYTVMKSDAEQLDDIRDIKGLILPPFKFQYLLISLGLIVGGIVIIIMLQTYQRKKLPSDPELPRTDFHRQALLRLNELEQRDLVGQSAFDLYHTELAGILREYIENIFGLRAREQTTEEFIKAVYQGEHFKSEQRQILDRYLHLADLVKFATFNPGSEISVDALNNVRTFIQATGEIDEV